MNFKQRKQQELKKKTGSYQKAFKKYGVHPKTLRWISEKSAELHLKELVADLDFEGKSVLDVGCGFGDILPHISRKAKKFDFTGIDDVELNEIQAEVIKEVLSGTIIGFGVKEYLAGDSLVAESHPELLLTAATYVNSLL